MENKYYSNVDLIKGVLILLVIIGHMLLGDINNNLCKYIIYTFHMPLFFAISGFLIKKTSIDLNFKSIFNKYLHRIIIPWLIANVIYFVIVKHNKLNLINFMKSIILQYNHLWFIVGFLLYLLMIYVCVRVKMDETVGLICAFAVSAVCKLLTYYIAFNPVDNEGIIKIALSIFLWNFRPQNFVFMYLGYYFRNYGIKKVKYLFPSIILIVLWVLNIAQFYISNKMIDFVSYFGINIITILIITNIISNNKLGNNKLLEWIGKNSMAIYLYHILGILITQAIILTNYWLSYYLASVIIQIIIMIVIYYLNKVKIVRKILFGLNV